MTIPPMPDLMPMLTDAEYAELLARAADLARHVLTTEPLSQDFTPTLVVHSFDPDTSDPRDPVTVCPLLGYDVDKRREILHATGELFGRDLKLLRAVFFLSEAWISRDRSYGLPENDPARQEVIIIGGLTIDGRSCLGRVHVTRDAANNMVAGETELFAYGPDAEVKVTSRICAHFFLGYQEGLRAALVAQGGAA
jgi:hypothetical protein